MSPSTKAAFRISAVYLFTGALWVLLSDRLVAAWFPPSSVSIAQTVKGWAFMAFVAMLLFWWVRRELKAREHSRATVRTTEANLAILLNQSLTGVFVIRDASLTYVNERFAEIFGYAPAELVGQPLEMVVHEGDRARVQALLERTWRTEGRQLFVFRGVRENSNIVHADVQTTLTQLDGAPAVLGILLDVTQRRVAEKQYQAARRLEAIGRMAGGVAHDFNNLLTAIRGAAALLRSRTDLPVDCGEDLQVILDTSERGAALSRQLLAFSRNRVKHAEPVDVGTILRDMRPLLQRLVHDHIRLELKLEAAPPIVADRHQIEQVVMNLVINARDAMPDGGTLRIHSRAAPTADAPPEARVVARGERLLRLDVEDTGAGIPDELQTRVFEPFFTTKGEHGTGLGLATVQGIVAQTGGYILLDSEPGRTCFALYFPASDQPVRQASARPGDAVPGDGRRARVLVVEDEAVVRAVTRRALERSGFDVAEAADGASARTYFAQLDSFGAVLLDVSLPDESGAEVARAIAAHGHAPPIVFMSGYGQEDIALPDDVRAAGFVEKPFTVEEIARAVADACR